MLVIVVAPVMRFGGEAKMLLSGFRKAARGVFVGTSAFLAVSCMSSLEVSDGSGSDQGSDAQEQKSFVLSPFHATVRRGDAEILNRERISRDFADMVEAGEDVHVKDELGTNPLHLAARGGMDAEVIVALLEAGLDVNATDGFGLTPLHVAMDYGLSLSMIDVLLKGGADVGSLSAEGLAPLHLLARNWKFGIENQDQGSLAERLRVAGFDVNAQDGGGATPLHYAVQHYNLGFVPVLLEIGADVHARDEKGMTPLHWMAQYRTPDFLRALAQWGWCTNIPEERWHFFEKYGLGLFPEHLGVSEWVWREDDDREMRYRWIRVEAESTFAECERTRRVMDVLLKAGADVDAVAPDGSSPLHYAAKYSNLVFVRTLLEAGADPNRKRKDGMPPLGNALMRDRPEYAMALLEAGASTEGIAPECAQGDVGKWAECAMRRLHAERKTEPYEMFFHCSNGWRWTDCY